MALARPQPPADYRLPRRLLFEMPGPGAALARLRSEHPGLRCAQRRSWSADPGPWRGRVGVWSWREGEEELRLQAEAVLLRFVHPLVARGLPYCVAFPFSAEALARRPLDLASRDGLDVEDIGLLLGATPAEPSAGGQRVRRVFAGPRPAMPAGPDAAAFDEAQLAAVSHDRGPARVLAPAGAGKTKTLVGRVVELVARGVDPAGILLLAFNRKAAEQLEERLAGLGVATTRRICGAGAAAPAGRPLAGAGRAVHVATFNAFGYRYQREVMGAPVAVDSRGTELRSALRRAVEACGGELAGSRGARGDPLGPYLGALTRVRAALEPAESIEMARAGVSGGPSPPEPLVFSAVHERYLAEQARSGAQSFDDQIYFALVDILADPRHRTFIQKRFEHILVDEFQDLNAAQLALVDVLSRPGRQLFVVGDDDQLIYGWRHAELSGILDFHKRLPPRPWSATYVLRTNYRCSTAVVRSAARLIVNNTRREDKDVAARGGAPPGRVRFAAGDSWRQRADAMCSFLAAEGERLGGWGALAVLCRYRTQQLPVALALDRAGIPRSRRLGCRLFSHPDAVLLRACLALAVDPQTLGGAQLGLLLARLGHCRREAAADVAAAAAGDAWPRLLRAGDDEQAGGRRPLSAFIDAAETLRAGLAGCPDLSPGELLWAVVDFYDLESQWGARPAEVERAPDESGPLQVLDALLQLAEDHETAGSCLAAWDRLLADEETAGGPDGEDEDEEHDQRVSICTIHAAKGREYGAVCIPDYNAELSHLEPATYEEERRVLYVAVTRACDTVLFTVDASRPRVHPFLRELVAPPDADEHASLRRRLKEAAAAESRAAAAVDKCRAELAALAATAADRPPAAPLAPAAQAGEAAARSRGGRLAAALRRAAGRGSGASPAKGDGPQRPAPAGPRRGKQGREAGDDGSGARAARLTQQLAKSERDAAGLCALTAQLNERLEDVEALFPETVPASGAGPGSA